MRLSVREETWKLDPPLRIARGAMENLGLIVVELEDDGGLRGRGEAVGVPYEGETPPSMMAQIADIASEIEQGLSRVDLQRRLMPGGARNALDCAMWDLEAKVAGAPVWQLAKLAPPSPLVTAFTIGLGDKDEVRAKARAASTMPLLKLKLDATRALDVVRIVRSEAPNARIIVDANQAWTLQQLNDMVEELAALGVLLIEQPLPKGADADLAGYAGAIKLAADESCTDRASLPALAHLYHVVNIKLDKTGGLTEALALAQEARRLDLEIMVGCMAGTSLSMAPASYLAQGALIVDLDGPLLHASDRPHGIAYNKGVMAPPARELWG